MSRTGRPSPRGTPRPRKTGSLSSADSSRIANGSHSLTARDGRLSNPRRAGVSRITVYDRFGSRAGVLEALAPPRGAPGQSFEDDPREALRAFLGATSASWSANPGLYRHLAGTHQGSMAPDQVHSLAER